MFYKVLWEFSKIILQRVHVWCYNQFSVNTLELFAFKVLKPELTVPLSYPYFFRSTHVTTDHWPQFDAANNVHLVEKHISVTFMFQLPSDVTWALLIQHLM